MHINGFKLQDHAINLHLKTFRQYNLQPSGFTWSFIGASLLDSVHENLYWLHIVVNPRILLYYSFRARIDLKLSLKLTGLLVKFCSIKYPNLLI